MVKYKEMEAKTILTPSGISGIDYVINPYIGCQFACQYCYAVFMSQFIGEPPHLWGEYVYAKKNAAVLLEKELARLMRKKTAALPNILISSATDPYQPLEAKYNLTHDILTVLGEASYSGEISILTKSPLVTRDITLMKKLPSLIVGMTITPGKDKGATVFESHAPKVEKRLDALYEVSKAGIRTYAFLAPILPQLCLYEKLMDELFSELKEINIEFIITEMMNTRGQISGRLRQSAAARHADFWRNLSNKAYKEQMRNILNRLKSKYGFCYYRNSKKTVVKKEEGYYQVNLFDSPIL